MYIIVCDGKVIHGPGNSTVLVSNPVLTTGIDHIGTLTFDLPAINPMSSEIVPMKSVVRVLDDHTELWRGRVLNFDSDFNNTASITCEGLLGYLNDLIVRPNDDDDLDPDLSIREYIAYILDIYNSQAEENKKIYIGEVTVTFPTTDYEPNWEIKDYQTSKAAIEQLKSKFGGHVQIRMDGERIFLDYLKDYTQEAVQEIIFAKNLMDLKKTISGDKIKTAIIPLGANVANERITIEEVNPTGKDYLIDETAQQEHGFILGTVIYDEIDDDDELYSKAVEEFPKLTGIKTTLSITAVDLSLLDKSLDAFKIGDLVKITSPPHGLNEQIQVMEIKLDLTNPDKSELTLGRELDSLTSSVGSSSSGSVQSSGGGGGAPGKVGEVPIGKKLLWSGNWNGSGNITVPGLQSYNLFLLRSTGGFNLICTYNDSDDGTITYLTAVTAYHSDTAQALRTGIAIVNGETLSGYTGLSPYRQMTHTNNGNHSGLTASNLVAIYGFTSKISSGSLDDSGWKIPTLVNGWVNYNGGTPFNTAAYRKIGSVVYMKGLVSRSSGTATLICNLPVGYRPKATCIFSVATNIAPAYAGRVDVNAVGDVTMVVGNNGWVSLENISFVAE